ncbi:MAG: slipin family protein, partial [Hyphomicrobium denitrificans]|nr:slipin family protein [Hyphomicrobium denitrificans]
ASSGTVVSEGLRGVVYKDGKFDREVGPGRHWISPRSTLRTVNVNEIAITVASQEVLSQDRLALRMSAIAIVRVKDVRKALETSAEGYYSAIYRTLQLALRDIASAATLEELLDQRGKLDEQLFAKAKAKAGCEEQGCELDRADVRDLMMPAEIRRIATDAVRAKLEAAASLERARGEQAALRALNNAARLLKGNPELMNLRVLQALSGANGKSAPTLVLSGGAGILPVQASPADDAASDDN